MDARPVDVAADDRAVGADLEVDDERDALLAFVEGGEAGGQLLGQHRKDARRGVDRGRVLLRVVVDGRAALDYRVDVGHGDETAHFPAAQVFGDGELVEIARVVVVDRAPEEVAHVAHAAAVVRGRTVDGVGLFLRGVGEVGGEAALEHGLPGEVVEQIAMRTSRLSL